MKKTILSKEEASKIRKELNSIWDISRHYWYPLYDCKRNDLIAFDSEYLDTDSKLIEIKNIFRDRKIMDIYEFREDGISTKISNIVDYDFWETEIYFWNNESFWFDSSKDWIIYKSHEGTTTFGGLWLVNKLKELWSDWNENISWDTKNKSR